jgi:hypothetical protein
MDKEFMLAEIRSIIAELEKTYRSYFSNENHTNGTNASQRSRAKRALDRARLIEYLLMYCPDTMVIDDQDLCDAFDKLKRF